MRYGVQQKLCVCTRLARSGIRNCFIGFTYIQRAVHFSPFFRPSVMAFETIVAGTSVSGKKCCWFFFCINSTKSGSHAFVHIGGGCMPCGESEWSKEPITPWCKSCCQMAKKKSWIFLSDQRAICSQEVTQMRDTPIRCPVRYGIDDYMVRSKYTFPYQDQLQYLCPCGQCTGGRTPPPSTSLLLPCRLVLESQRLKE